jgi:hypothetical protein
MAEKTCRFICDRASDDSPSEPIAEEIYEKFVRPVVESNFDDFVVHLFRYEDTPGLSSSYLEDMSSVDLVIADITTLNQHAFFALGVRQESGKPLVLIADENYILPLRPTDLKFVPYRYDDGFVEDAQAAIDLASAIDAALNSAKISTNRTTQVTPQQSRERLVARLSEAADSIRLLRINSAAEIADELDVIAIQLSAEPLNRLPLALKETLDSFFKIAVRLSEQLATVRGSRMLISGIIAVVLGGTGISAVSAFAISLAFWEGKDAFLGALERLAKRPSK